MEEAAIELRSAINLALSLDQNVNEQNHQHNNNNHELLELGIGGTSEGTYISSLSGSLPSERSNVLASRRKNYYDINKNIMNNNNHNILRGEDDNGIVSRHTMQRQRIQAASRLENAAANYELAVFNYYNTQQTGVPPSSHHQNNNIMNDGSCNDEQQDIVDLLVGLLTAVPRHLLQHLDYPGERVVHNNHQEDVEYLSSMEQLCYNTAFISSDIIRKYFVSVALNLNMNNPPTLEDQHVYELVDEVVQICNTDQEGRGSESNIEPIIRLLNALSEGRDIERALSERENGSFDSTGSLSLFLCVPSKDALLLGHTLMYRYLCDLEDQQVETPSSNVGYFICYLLEHFANVTLEEMGYNSFDECKVGLLDSWADSVDEHMVRRLNDEEVKDVHSLLVRFHVASIQSSLHLIDNSESVISSTIAESEKKDNTIDNGTIESLVVTLQETIHHMTMVATTTEVLEKLGLEHDPEIHSIFNPLISSYAKFTVSALHNALLFLRGLQCGDSTNEIEDLSILADDLLFRLCGANIGIDFLKSSPYTKGREEVLTVALLLAMNTQCITGKTRFLLDVAAEHASQLTDNGNGNAEPTLKRQRFSSSMRSGHTTPLSDRMHSNEDLSSSEEMMDIILACLALSHSNQDNEHLDSTNLKQASCITSALMFSQDDGKASAALDPLNPWHTLQVKPLQKLALNDAETPGILAYSKCTPHLLNTKLSY